VAHRHFRERYSELVGLYISPLINVIRSRKEENERMRVKRSEKEENTKELVNRRETQKEGKQAEGTLSKRYKKRESLRKSQIGGANGKLLHVWRGGNDSPIRGTPMRSNQNDGARLGVFYSWKRKP